MSKQVTFLVDECVGKPIMEELAHRLCVEHRQSKYAHTFAFEHVTDFLRSGVHDEEWVPRIAGQGYIVISADRGKGPRKNKGEKLPLLCRRNGVTHVLLSSALHHSPSERKAAALEQVFPDLMELASAPRGSRFRLEVKRGRVRLVNQDLEAKKSKKKKA